jgi:cytochrome c oxidase cbb3-type subunit 1
MYVVRGLGGVMYLTGALIMCFNLWKTATSMDEMSSAPAVIPAE